MAMFYVGQPVICIDDEIKPVVARMFPQVKNWPVRGQTYTIRRNMRIMTRMKGGWTPLTFVLLRELTNPRIMYMSGRMEEAGFHEIRFVPATDIGDLKKAEKSHEIFTKHPDSTWDVGVKRKRRVKEDA
jgi:hypothetical protein